MQFDTVRSPAGEALFQLKYRFEYAQAPIIAHQMAVSLAPYFHDASLVVPMLPSRQRSRQPVVEIARELARLMRIPCYEDLLTKTNATPAVKDIGSRIERVDALVNAFAVNDVLGEGFYNVLVVDDLFDTGSSLEAATRVLRTYSKIRRVCVATVTRRR
jgi:predicted amidophosphoribosyltransferase